MKKPKKKRDKSSTIAYLDQLFREVLVIVLLSTLLSASLLPGVHAVGWTSLGGATLSSPAVLTDGLRYDVVVRGTDNRVYHKYRTSPSGIWSSWIPLAGATHDQPALAYQFGYLNVVVRGTDNGLYHKMFYLPSGPWDATWTKVGGATLSAPALAVYGGMLYLFVRGTDNGIYYNAVGVNWGSWIKVPGGKTNDVPAVLFLNGNARLVVRGLDNGVYFNRASLPPAWPIVWSGWTSLGGATSSAPTLEAVFAPDYVNLVVRGTNDRVYYKRLTWGGSDWVWTGWINLGGGTIDRPALWASSGWLNLFVRGSDNGVYFKSMNLVTWIWDTNWLYTSGKTLSAPAINDYLCVRGMDNKIYYE